MGNNHITNWCNELRAAWLAKDFSKLATIFSKTTSYFEDPFTEPGTSIEEIISYWDEIIFQKIVSLAIEPLIVSKDRATLHWYLDYKDTRDSEEYVMDGVYYIEFNDLFECTSFRQWWVLKE